MNGELEGLVAVVTGASRGIGAAIAHAFAREGATVVAAARSEEQLQEVVHAIAECGGLAAAVRCDVTRDDDVDRLARVTADTFGRADVLVNNAGVYQSGRFTQYDLSEFDRIMSVNWMGTVRTTRAFLPPMLEAGRGRVINVASTAGKYGSLYQSPYNSSKHAVVGLTRCLALETAKSGVRVNAICPGFVETDLIDARSIGRLADAMEIGEEDVLPAILRKVPMGRFVRPEEVARMAVYLASPAADAVTGQSLTIDGGLILV